ncbi:hypothetical protein IKF04_03435 [Candidatus Saccharibacteria bacterium]|nr:hypothetical protein [Candidatus Saccharibacteria bacterium]
MMITKWFLEESVGGYDRDRRSAPPVTTGWRDSVSEKNRFRKHLKERIYYDKELFSTYGSRGN